MVRPITKTTGTSLALIQQILKAIASRSTYLDRTDLKAALER
jgi:hypothetical protein